MDKKLIAEDIQRMRFMFGYEPGKVISEQQDINELGGMEDGHPKFGKMNFSKMSDEEIENVLMNLKKMKLSTKLKLKKGLIHQK